MNGVGGARVVLLDDQPTEAMPVIKAFSKMGIPIAFFDGNQHELPPQNKRLSGVRLAILDMNLGVTGSDETIAGTLVQTFGSILHKDNGPYGILIWTNHPDLKELVARYIYEHDTLPKPVFIVTLKKAAFKISGMKGAPRRFAMTKLSKELVKVLGDNSPLECLQVWEGMCFRAATNVTNNISDLHGVPHTNLEQWRQAWKEETLKMLLVISKATAEQHHTRQNCIPSIFLALNPLHSDRMGLLTEPMAEGLKGHLDQIMNATGSSAIERKSKVNSMLHLGFDQSDTFSPGNLYFFNKKSRPGFLPKVDEVLQDCLQGNPGQQAAAAAAAILCGIEVTPTCDHAQKKMRVSRVLSGFVVPWDQKAAIKSAGFLKLAGPFYLPAIPKTVAAGPYLVVFNSRYMMTATLSDVVAYSPDARVRSSMLADIQSWTSYQASRQGVVMLA